MVASGASDTPAGGHAPVLLDAVMASLAPVAGRRVIDGTFGAGGYSRALLDAGAGVCAIDRDPAAGRFADALAGEFPERFRFVAGRFSSLDSVCGGAADAVVLDIGVSSMQIDEAGRGFSFMRDGPLDMRMSGDGPTAADLVASLPEKTLADLIYGLGEERRSRAVARAIVAARRNAPLATTLELANLVASVVRHKPGDIHPATRTFQALRVAVNAEYTELVEGLFAAERLLHAGGVLSVVTFHSIEDRIVKRFFRPVVTATRHRPAVETVPPSWEARRPVRPGDAEVVANPRARSATLRSGVRTDARPRPVSHKGLGVPAAAIGGAL